MATELTPTKKITEGEQIKGLFKRPSSGPVTVDSKKYGIIKFVIKPMDNDIYAKMGEVMDGKGIDLNTLSQIEGLKVFSSMYYPAMRVVFPACCITPKVIDGSSTDSAVLCVKDIPMIVCLELIQQIM